MLILYSFLIIFLNIFDLMPILIIFCIIFAAGNSATQFNYLCFMFIDFDDFDYHVLPDPCDVPEGKIEYDFDGLGIDPIDVDPIDVDTDFNQPMYYGN